MARTLIGNFMGPEGPRGPQGEQGPRGPQGEQGEQGELQPFDGRNFIKVTDETEARNGNIEKINGTDVFTATGSISATSIDYPNEYELKEGKTYVISYDYYSETVANSDRLWIVNLDGSHANYSITPTYRHDYTNVFDIPLGEEIRCYIVFKPSHDLIGTLRVGANRNGDDNGSFEIKNVSLSEGYDISYKPKSDPTGVRGTDYHLFANLTGSIPYSSTYSDKNKMTIAGSPDGWNSSTQELTLPGPGNYQIMVQLSPNTFSQGVVEVDIRNGDTVLSSARGDTPRTTTVFGSVSTISAVPRINVAVAHGVSGESFSLRGSNSNKIYIKKLPN